MTLVDVKVGEEPEVEYVIRCLLLTPNYSTFSDSCNELLENVYAVYIYFSVFITIAYFPFLFPFLTIQ